MSLHCLSQKKLPRQILPDFLPQQNFPQFVPLAVLPAPVPSPDPGPGPVSATVTVAGTEHAYNATAASPTLSILVEPNGIVRHPLTNKGVSAYGWRDD